ncbi:MAG: Asp-tRNA(Asn)/Glu-tRNA(Gln) amidotransferase subunit GatC [Fusobacteria bacterium]|nr:Asp-tRNA(Asn)/Glu-tRNA(Gln) amidotransferase subunit GatC [Fusobacteriota bacterium]
MSITKDNVLHVAGLARLDLSQEEVARYEVELNDVLEFMEKLNELDTQGVEPTTHVLDISNVFRQDIVEASSDVEEILANAPDREDDYFKVPSIL